MHGAEVGGIRERRAANAPHTILLRVADRININIEKPAARDQGFFVAFTQTLDLGLALCSGGAGFHGFLIDQAHGPSRKGIAGARRIIMVVLGNAPCDIGGNAGIQTIIRTSQHVHVPHGDNGKNGSGVNFATV